MAKKVIKRRGKFPTIPGMDQELDSLISQLSHKDNVVEPVTTINNITTGVSIDDSEPLEAGTLNETYSCFKINQELSNHPLILEYYEVVGLQALEVGNGQDGEVSTDRNLTCVWTELRDKQPYWFEDRWIYNGLNGEDIGLTYEMSKRLMDYCVFFYVTLTKTPPVNMFPGDPTVYPEGEGWFFWGYTDSNRAVIKCPIGASVAVWVGFRQKNTISAINRRIYKYLN